MTVFMRKVSIDGYRFDSDAESKYYLLLKERISKGEVSCLTVHPIFPLQEGFRNAMGGSEKPINYVADFSFYDKAEKKERIVDVKGWIGQDDSFPLHRKLFDFKYGGKGYCLEVLRYSKSTGFVPYDDYRKERRRKVSEAKAERNVAVKKAERIKYVFLETALLEAKKVKTPQDKARLTRLTKEKARLLS